MQQLTYWYLEAAAYHIDGNVFIKELALLKGDRTQCWTYYIHQHASPLPTSPQYLLQKSLLGLSWNYGDHSLEEAIALIKEKISDADYVFISDSHAYHFIKQFLPLITYQPCEIGFQIKHCPSEYCDLKHSFDLCARRKVHEIRFADYHEL